MVEIRTRDVFATMRPELLLVQSRLEEAARIDFPGVADLIIDLLRAGGKRLRPLVLLLAGRAFAYDRETLVTAGAGVELLHTASLVHDDTVDRAGMRRGRPTLNSVLPSGAVILLGDFLFAQSAMLAAATNSPRVVSIFASTLADICDGQLREMFFANRLDQSREEYERRIFGKTASLFAGSAEMGAVIGNAPESAVQALRRYGSDVGMAFQIVDDVLDLREGTSQLGKPAGHDLTQGTVTLPTIIYASSLTGASDAALRLESVVSGEIAEPAEVARVVKDIRDSGALESAMEEALEFATRSKTHIAAAPDPETRDMLEQIADVVCERSA
ncbi:MAG TPA: polyprenyl synthetase family protein [Thermomicrobiales bacterium]|nr:polyprenyl synthetase family protein [Thermomicrobiales bacterium]